MAPPPVYDGDLGGWHAQSVEQRETILRYDVPLTSLAGLVGQHSFPFAVRLPEALPPSVEVRTVDVDVEVHVARAMMAACSQKMHVFTRYGMCPEGNFNRPNGCQVIVRP